MTTIERQRKMHFDLLNLELRAQATAVGLVQLCIELQGEGLLSGGAMSRIKDAIADEVSMTRPRGVDAESYRREMAERLDRLFTGEQQVGTAEALSFGTTSDG